MNKETPICCKCHKQFYAGCVLFDKIFYCEQCANTYRDEIESKTRKAWTCKECGAYVTKAPWYGYAGDVTCGSCGDKILWRHHE